MDSPIHHRISRRRKKSTKEPNLRQTIAQKTAECLIKHDYIGLIGDDGTGRNTLVRRFLNMSDGPFRHPEDKKYKCRDILVHLGERPNVPSEDLVSLTVHICNLQELDFSTLFQVVRNLESLAVVFDVGESPTFHTAIFCMIKIADFLKAEAPKFILVGNKSDRPHHDISPARGQEVAETCGAQRYYSCSALMNMNVDPVLDALLLMTFF